MIRCSTMWAQKSSSLTEPIEVTVTTIRHRPPRKHARRQPGTARGVPARWWARSA